MNAAESIVESYYRICKKCLTISDFKVQEGNNRQFDLLAYSVIGPSQYHIEVSVTHVQKWCPTVEDLKTDFGKKFFGISTEKLGGKKDLGCPGNKSYLDKIERSYASIGFSHELVKRVWVCWAIKNEQNGVNPLEVKYSNPLCYSGKEFTIEVISLRDQILPNLLHTIGTSNYENEIIRSLSLINQYNVQINLNKN